jgi:hypothetical protein
MTLRGTLQRKKHTQKKKKRKKKDYQIEQIKPRQNCAKHLP